MKTRVTAIALIAVIFIACVTGLGYMVSIALSGPANPQPPSPDLVPLEVELPNSVPGGTPPHTVVIPRLEKDAVRPRLMVPADVANVALAKPVTSTDDLPIIGELEYITDGDKAAAEGCFVELAPGLQHVTIDLGAPHEIFAISFWHFYKEPRAFFDCIVRIADDPDFITNVRTLFNNDHDNSVGLGVGADLHYLETNEGKLIDAKGHNARYVRLYSNGSSISNLNYYTEVEVYGRPAVNAEKMVPLKIDYPHSSGHIDMINHSRIANLELPSTSRPSPLMVPEGTKNVALHKPVLSTCESPLVGELAYVTDGVKQSSSDNLWPIVQLDPGLQSITIDLEEYYNIYAVAFWHYHMMNPVFYDVIVQTAGDSDFTENVHTLFNNDHDNTAGLGVGSDKNYIEGPWGKTVAASGIKARYVRLYSNGGVLGELNPYVEVEVYGRPAK